MVISEVWFACAIPAPFAFTRMLVKRKMRVVVPGGSNGTP